MADAFDDLLAVALAPPERVADRQFVTRVQAAIAIEEQLAAQRRGIVTELARQLVALAAVAGGLWWISRAAPVASWLVDSPSQALAILLLAFAFVVGIFVLRPARGSDFNGLARYRS
jgi:hypothetical protein